MPLEVPKEFFGDLARKTMVEMVGGGGEGGTLVGEWERDVRSVCVYVCVSMKWKIKEERSP